MPGQRSKADGIRLTKVGLWFLIFLAILVVAAANTGNNGIYLVLAAMMGAILVAHLVGAWNVRGLQIAAHKHDEVFAQRATHLDIRLSHRGRFLPRWMLLVTVEPDDVRTPLFVPALAAQATIDDRLEVLMSRRGRRKIKNIHVTSLFPVGFFAKGRRYEVDLDVLVYPELLAPTAPPAEQSSKRGEEDSRRPGWGHEMLGLRAYRSGDDPRSIHWKQSARTGDLIFKERETEENRELLIVLDNAVGELDEEGARRFERLVSEAATAAVDYLEQGYEVALHTRNGLLPAHSGQRQRLMILETLALLEAVPQTREPLVEALPDDGHLHLSMQERAMEEVA